MREIKFRGMEKPSDYVMKCGYIPKMVYGTGVFCDPVNTWLVSHDDSVAMAFGITKYIIDPNTLGQCTSLRDKNGLEIYEGDIVKVLTNRIPQYEREWNPRSKYDCKKIESRSVIVFERYEWRLNIDTVYNRRILELKGSETDTRRLSIRKHLKEYDFFQESNPSSAFNREHNFHAYWSDIEVIGNIYENPELIDG